MNDLISRKAAIDGIKKRFCTDCDNYKGVRCRACNFDEFCNSRNLRYFCPDCGAKMDLD